MYLTPEDLARRWKVSLETIRSMRKEGRLPEAANLGLRVVRWPRAVIERFEREGPRRRSRRPGTSVESVSVFPRTMGGA